MAKYIFYLGLILMALPFLVMGLEVGIAILTHATGDHASSAGFWGVWLGFITFLPGVLLAFIGGLLWFMER